MQLVLNSYRDSLGENMENNPDAYCSKCKKKGHTDDDCRDHFKVKLNGVGLDCGNGVLVD